jgi:hypothetical protein
MHTRSHRHNCVPALQRHSGLRAVKGATNRINDEKSSRTEVEFDVASLSDSVFSGPFFLDGIRFPSEASPLRTDLTENLLKGSLIEIPNPISPSQVQDQWDEWQEIDTDNEGVLPPIADLATPPASRRLPRRDKAVRETQLVESPRCILSRNGREITRDKAVHEAHVVDSPRCKRSKSESETKERSSSISSLTTTRLRTIKQSEQATDPKQYVYRRLARYFVVKSKKKVFYGVVVDHRRVDGVDLFRVHYEDGDLQDMGWDELRYSLDLYEQTMCPTESTEPEVIKHPSPGRFDDLALRTFRAAVSAALNASAVLLPSDADLEVTGSCANGPSLLDPSAS